MPQAIQLIKEAEFDSSNANGTLTAAMKNGINVDIICSFPKMINKVLYSYIVSSETVNYLHHLVDSKTP